MSRIEDFSVGVETGISSGWIIDARTNRRLYRTMSFSLEYSAYVSSNLLFLGFSKGIWYRGSVDYRKTANLSIRYYNNSLSWLTPAVMILYGEDRRLDGRKGFYLGENYGLRAFPRYFDEGEKLLRVNIENRLYTGWRIFSAILGFVQFIDVGQVWSNGETFSWQESLRSIGIGLRIGTERVSNAEMIRIDLAYAENIRNWQISFGVGQYLQ